LSTAYKTLSSSTTTSVRPRFVDRLPPTLVNALTACGFVAPVLAYFWFIDSYGVNAIYEDQWNDVALIGNFYRHGFSWGALWTQHNDNRIFFPNLIVLLLVHTTHFDVRVEQVLSAIMLIAAAALLIWSHKRRSPRVPWLYYCPAVILLMSFAQYQNTLWGFQLAWYLVLLSLALVIFIVDRVTLSAPALAAAIAVAIVGSYSSTQGLLIWPVGLLLLLYRSRSAKICWIWTAAAALTVSFYFFRYQLHVATSVPPLPRYPVFPLLFAIFAIGDGLGVLVKPGQHNTWLLLLGAFIGALAIASLCRYAFRRDNSTGSPIGVCLCCFGLGFVALIAFSRSRLGYYEASVSRYVTFDFLIVLGVLFMLLGRSPSSDGAQVSRGQEQPPRALSVGATPEGLRRWVQRNGYWILCWGAALVILLDIVIGTVAGLSGASDWKAIQLRAACTARSVSLVKDSQILVNLNLFESPTVIRQDVRDAQVHHLSLFIRGGYPAHGSGSVAGSGTQLDGIGAIAGFSHKASEYNLYDLSGYSEVQAANAIYDNYPVAGLAAIKRYNPHFDPSRIEIPNVPGLPVVSVPELQGPYGHVGTTPPVGQPYGTGTKPGTGSQAGYVGALSGFSHGNNQYNLYDLSGYSEVQAANAIYDNDPVAGLAVIERHNPHFDPSRIEIPNVPGLPVIDVPPTDTFVTSEICT
jgi:hypothetical protein